MKRRNFIATAGTIGIAGSVSGASLASSAFTDMNSFLLVETFSPATKKVWRKFKAAATQNTQSLGLTNEVAKRMVSPASIIEQTKKGITFQNINGDQVCISIIDGKEKIMISKQG